MDIEHKYNKLANTVIQIGKDCAVSITGDPEDASFVNSTPRALRAIKTVLIMSKRLNNEVNKQNKKINELEEHLASARLQLDRHHLL